jgi:NTP pyrophosphatase (non-canonical NTP hydrolase)
MKTYRTLELEIIRWADARGILKNSTPLAQAIKTTEEVAELLKALSRGDIKEARDAYSDIMVTLIIGSAIADVDLVDCLNEGYEVIRYRTGKLTADGIFVKDA